MSTSNDLQFSVEVSTMNILLIYWSQLAPEAFVTSIPPMLGFVFIHAAVIYTFFIMSFEVMYCVCQPNSLVSPIGMNCLFS